MSAIHILAFCYILASLRVNYSEYFQGANDGTDDILDHLGLK